MKRRHQAILFYALGMGILVCSSASVASRLKVSSAFSAVSRRKRIRRRQLYSATLPDPPSETIDYSESNFWRTIVRRNSTDLSSSQTIPCIRALDSEGPLPEDAYQMIGKVENEPRPTCLLSVAPQTGENVDPGTDVAQAHRLIDSGFNTFHHGGGKNSLDDIVYQKLHSETPASVLRRCHFVVPYRTPSTNVLAQPSIVRDTVLQIMSRTGAKDCIDTLQIKYTKGSPYHLDVLDVLYDLQREGYIRSIATRDMPATLLREAVSSGFMVDSNEISCNLFDPSSWSSPEMKLACDDLGTKLLLSSPLAGGMLTDRYSDARWEPYLHELSPTERHYMRNVVTPWARTLSDDSDYGVWNVYQTKMMNVLGVVALKHGVSVASVALRWALQLDPNHVASTVVSCRLGTNSDDGRPWDRPQQLRQVFSFKLDEEDMECLWKTTGEEDTNEDLNLLDFEHLGLENEREGNSLILPDPSSQKLWL